MRAPSRAWKASAITSALFFVGAALGLSFLSSVLPWGAVVIAAAFVTALDAVGRLTASPRKLVRVAAWAARCFVLSIHAFWIYLLASWGVLLAWSTPFWLRADTAIAAALAIATIRRKPEHLRVPVALPMGVWIAGCLAGWLREEAFVRCDDHARMKAQQAVTLVVATTAALDRCRAHEVLPIGRYPRKTWESADGRRYVFTTQTSGRYDPSKPSPGRLDGLFCETPADGSAEPRCVGPSVGKAHGIVEAEPRGELFAVAWQIRFDDGRRGSVVYRMSRDRPLEILSERRFDATLGEFVYQPRHDRLWLFSDDGEVVRPIRAGDLSSLPEKALDAIPGETRWDGARDEGVLCGSKQLLTAVRGPELDHRVLADNGLPALSWGCDWDPERRKVYSAIANLGLLATIDYDTGKMERVGFVGFGLRGVALDRARRRVYLTDFLGGDVIAVDAETSAEVGRWFVGRFVREVRLTRDGSALLASSNLGLVRIKL